MMSWRRAVTLFRFSGVVGVAFVAALWLGWIGSLSLLEKALSLGIWVVVPFGLSMIPQEPDDAPAWRLYQALALAQPVCALCAYLSLAQEKWGISAALLASAWLLVTIGCGFLGLFRLLGRPWRWDAELCVDVALAYVVVGGVWFVSARLGYQLLGFDMTIVFLTAVHFHFASFAGPLVTGLVGRSIPAQAKWGQRLYKLVVFSVVLMPGVIAIAFSRIPLLEAAAVCAFALSLCVLGVLMLGWVMPRQSSWPIKGLLLISGLSLFVSMALAIAYTYGKFMQQDVVSISYMAKTHGLINALGFALCGLCAFLLMERGSG